ncbi:quaternary amine ABC transporter ATP-binding protein [Natranaerobius trueperi]|uniref:Quaternary amine transport ATP-binding protein n=1 Tax=Natranaerobius trueperi TaxID=759412 RepID=A0A226BV89_9FIRM|nr:glycine betaine/L-proline ABC transporter ATP-binding protein [Natranaerobius trueperi]OWZ82958.1 ABC transporter ATP-binding protein [Natranaerobius trueperi]
MVKKLEAKNVYKIFGPRPDRVFSLIEKGMDKEDILKKTGNTLGVNDASFEVNEGEIFVIMGLSGSGKSTLIRCVNRLIEPTRGEILIDGEDITKMNSEKLREVRRAKLGMVFQHFALFPHRTVLDNVTYGLEVQNVPYEERAKVGEKALEQVGLKDYAQQRPSGLSGGMQQRVGLARALALDPDILIMDEPFSALDPLIRRDMQSELIELQSNVNKTILFITHDLDEALKLGDKIAIMKDGEVVQIGEPEDILSNPANEYVANFVRDVNRLKILTAGNIMDKPEVTININDGPRKAIRVMEKEGFSNLYVVDKEKRVYGVIEDTKALEALKNNEKSLKNYLNKDYPYTTEETPLSELLQTASESNYPIAVFDENEEKLRGLIVRVSVLAALAEGEDVEGEEGSDNNDNS